MLFGAAIAVREISVPQMVQAVTRAPAFFGVAFVTLVFSA